MEQISSPMMSLEIPTTTSMLEIITHSDQLLWPKRSVLATKTTKVTWKEKRYSLRSHSLQRYKELHIKTLISLDTRMSKTPPIRIQQRMMEIISGWDKLPLSHLEFLLKRRVQTKQIVHHLAQEKKRNGNPLCLRAQLLNRQEERSLVLLMLELRPCLDKIESTLKISQMLCQY